jgi:hypothetical protein
MTTVLCSIKKCRYWGKYPKQKRSSKLGRYYGICRNRRIKLQRLENTPGDLWCSNMKEITAKRENVKIAGGLESDDRPMLRNL